MGCKKETENDLSADSVDKDKDFNKNNDGCNALSKYILTKLRPFQREAFDFATQQQYRPNSNNINRNNLNSKNQRTQNSSKRRKLSSAGVSSAGAGTGRILLADEMGLGKTVTSLAIMTHYQTEWPLLILCPASLRHTWPTEIETFIPSLPPSATYIVSGFDDVNFISKLNCENDNHQQKKNRTIQIVIATYSLLQYRSAAARALQQFPFQCVIADESHNLKEKSSQRFQLVEPILQRAKRLLLLSGTPALAKPVELWTQIHCLDPKLIQSYTSYTHKYCNAKRTRFGWDVSGASNKDELNQLLKTFMIRRLKSNVLTELPPKQRSIIPIKINPHQQTDSNNKSQYKQCQSIMKELKETRISINQLVGKEANQAHFEAKRILMKAYQICGIAKAKAIADYVLDWLRGSGTQKILVFAHHTEVMDIIEHAVSKHFKKAIGHIRIDGSVPSAERATRVRAFQNKAHVRLGLLSMTAAGVGLTLTAASSVLFAELHWTPGVLAQAEDRCHRIGQPNAVHIMYCVCNDETISVDMSLWSMLSRKIGNIGSIIDGTKNASMNAKETSEEDRLRLGLGPDDKSASNRGLSGEEELTSFFAESSILNNREQKKNTPVVRGSIQSFFLKQNSMSKKVQNVDDPKRKLAITSALTSTTSCASNKATTPLFVITPEQKKSKRQNKVIYLKSIASNNTITFACKACTFLNKNKSISKTKILSCEICGTTHIDDDIDTKSHHKINNSQHGKETNPQTQSPNKCVVLLDEDSNTHSLPTTGKSIPTLPRDIIEIFDDDNHSDDNDQITTFKGNENNDILKNKIEKVDKDKNERKNEDSDIFSFSVSKNSGRVTIHLKKTGESLMINFDIEHLLTDKCTSEFLEMRTKRMINARKGLMNAKSEITQSQLEFVDERLDKLVLSTYKESNHKIHEDLHVDILRKEIISFVRCFTSLREVEKKTLKEWGQPLTAKTIHLQLAKIYSFTGTAFSNVNRYVGGAKERAIEKSKNSLTLSDHDQAIIDGHACAWCGQLLHSTSFKKDVKSTYCSQKCAEDGRLRRGGMYASTKVRNQVFALENGVCQICGINAHALFMRISAMQPAERLNALCNSNWKLPKSQSSLQRILLNPKEGDFWQADHIVPVAEGGGGCGLDNLQTLCTPCHNVETEKLRTRLRLHGSIIKSHKNGISGQNDIRQAFFGLKRTSHGVENVEKKESKCMKKFSD